MTMSLEGGDKFMKTDEKSSIRIIRRIVFVSIIVILVLAVGVFASRTDVNYVTIKFSDDTSISIVTTKVKVSEILAENNIVLLDDEEVLPSLNSNINALKTIEISKKDCESIVVAEEVSNVTTEQILGEYVTVTEKIITEQIEIPYETVTKDISQTGAETTDTVLQEGKNGLKEIKYKVKYQNEEEVSRIVISEEVLEEPVDKIIQVSTKIVSRSSSYRVSSGISLASTVSGVTPTVTTMNVSAYTASTCGKSSSDPNYGKTSSGAYASSWYTIAAGPSVPIGTVVYIPYFASQANGGWFVVEDRGGAITNSRIDVYMDTLSECTSFGRRNLECYVYY
jgi:3D (Asp-Asp-Asp) domain-containing protein